MMSYLYIVVKENHILGLAGSDSLQVTAAVRGPAAGVPLNAVALQGVAQLIVHLLLLSVCQDHHWPATSSNQFLASILCSWEEAMVVDLNLYHSGNLVSRHHGMYHHDQGPGDNSF